MASSGLLLSIATFIIAVSLTPGIARGKHRGVAVLHSSESFYFRKSPPRKGMGSSLPTGNGIP
jgi:hypothetical protein